MTARLQTSALAVSLAGSPVLSVPALAFEPAIMVAILGPNGAGKTTLLKAIAGLVPHDAQLASDGHALNTLSPSTRAKQVAYLPQGHQACWPLPAREIVALGRLPHGASDPRRLSRAHSDAVDDAMQRTETTAFADRPVTELSGGERARVMLARVLAGEPNIILADEPTAALDPRHQHAVMQELRQEATRGALVLAVTHDLVLADRISDRVLLMHEGEIVADGTPAEVLTSEALAKVYGIKARRLPDGMLVIDGAI